MLIDAVWKDKVWRTNQWKDTDFFKVEILDNHVGLMSNLIIKVAGNYAHDAEKLMSLYGKH